MKIIGVVTENFSLYYELVHLLKHDRIPFVSLSLSDSIPANVGVVITSRDESDKIRFKKKLVIGKGDDHRATINEALRMISGKDRYNMLVIGIDPGNRPGLAVLGDGIVVETAQIASPEEVAVEIERILPLHPAKDVRVRIGHGDKTNRNRIINSLSGLPVIIEIVDEKGTTKHSVSPDIQAAIDIAHSEGEIASPPLKVEPSEGEIRNIQRQSRIFSDGRVTISATLAKKVALGEITLEEAVSLQQRG
jgi:hypothetical protein